MATHSNVLAWSIPGTGEPGGCRLWGGTESTRLKQLSSSSSSKRARLIITWNDPLTFNSKEPFCICVLSP